MSSRFCQILDDVAARARLHAGEHASSNCTVGFIVGGVELQFRAAFADDTVVPFAPTHEPGSFVVIRRLARSGATGLYLVKPAAQPLPRARVFLVRITTDENATLNGLKRSGS